MTVKGMFSEFDKLKSMGALAVIAKPFDPTTLTQQIKNILTTNGFQPEDRANFAGESNELSFAPNNFPAQSSSFSAEAMKSPVEAVKSPVDAKNFSSELNKVATRCDPSASTSEMIISDGTNQPSGSVETASIKWRLASSAAKSMKSGRGARGKTSRPVRIAQRIIARKKLRRR
jgi:hypothetical protein